MIRVRAPIPDSVNGYASTRARAGCRIGQVHLENLARFQPPRLDVVPTNLERRHALFRTRRVKVRIETYLRAAILATHGSATHRSTTADGVCREALAGPC